MTHKLTLYAAPKTRALRVLWLLTELELAHDLVLVDFKPTSDRFFIQDTPTGKIPTLTDGKTVICESGAIIQYILERYGNGRLEPALDDPRRGAYLQWFHYAEATAFGPLGNIVWLTSYRDDGSDNAALVNAAMARAKTGLKYIEKGFTHHDYLIGDDFTAADIMMGFTLLVAEVQGQMNADTPKLKAYLERLKSRPAFLNAFMTLGGHD